MRIELMEKTGSGWRDLPANYLAGISLGEWLDTLEGSSIVARIHVEGRQVVVGGTQELRDKLAKKYKLVLGFDEMKRRLDARESPLLEVTVPHNLLQIFPGTTLAEVNDEHLEEKEEVYGGRKGFIDGDEGVSQRLGQPLRGFWKRRAEQET